MVKKTEEAMDERLIAEVKLHNANKALEKTKREIAEIDETIAAKETEIARLEGNYEESRGELSDLTKQEEKLQSIRRERENRLKIVKGTPDEKHSQVEWSQLLGEIDQHRILHKAATDRRDLAAAARADIPILQKDITYLQKERDKKQKHYDDMYPLWQAEYWNIGQLKTVDLKDKIESQEDTIHSLESQIEEAKRQLESLQLSIKEELYGWPDCADKLQRSHGKRTKREHPSRTLMRAWYSFIEVLRDIRDIPTLVEIREPNGIYTECKIHELLELKKEDIAYFAYTDNWRRREVSDERGYMVWMLTNPRADIIRHAINSYKDKTR